MTKESYLPVAVTFSSSWLLIEFMTSKKSIYNFAWVIVMCFLRFMTIAFVRWVVGSDYIEPVAILNSFKAKAIELPSLGALIYVFIWLIPMGVVNLRSFPATWVFASGVATFIILILATWVAAGSNVSRYLFNLNGGLLSLSAAVFLKKFI